MFVEQYISDLLNHPKVLETRDHLHHSIPKHDHLLRSVRYSYRFARLLRADVRTCLRAAIVHDIDSRFGTLTNHGEIAAKWAAEQGEPNEVCTAIVSHMYPFGPAPTTREAWVLVFADKAASLGDFAQLVSGLFTGRSLAERRRLCASDPFYCKRESIVKRMRQRRRTGSTL
jgi:HD superfamily phosphodiesterase